MIPDTPERRLQALRQQLAIHSDLSDLLKAVGEDMRSQLYRRTHGALENHALLSHCLGESKGIENFIKDITAGPTSGRQPHDKKRA